MNRPRTLAPLLSLALCAACGGSGPEPWLREEASARGLEFQHVSGAEGAYLMPEIMGGGAALFDMDQDGDLDAYLVQSGAPLSTAADRPPNQLYENIGSGNFRDISAASGADHRGCGMGVCAGDVDGDGAPDLFVTNVGPDVLLRNRGAGRFEAAGASGGLDHPGWGSSCAFLDRDRDGDLDLFVATYLHWDAPREQACRNHRGEPDYCSPTVYEAPSPDLFYDNDGGGGFVDVSAASGVGAVRAHGLGVVVGDLDNDGWPDVFVANDAHPDHLWINQGGLRFEEQALARGCALDDTGAAKAGMGVDLADLDDDGRPDLLVGNLEGQTDSLLMNTAAGFRDRTARLGLGSISRVRTRFGLGFVDLDRDGWLDLYEANGRVMRNPPLFHPDDPYAEPNRVLRGLPGGGFAALVPGAGTASPMPATSRAAAFGDVDGDGAVDVLVVNRDAPAQLLMNVAPAAGGWIGLSVELASGAHALGARLELELGDRMLMREVRATRSYLASSDPRLYLGLGSEQGLASVVVRWPDGARESFGALAGGRVHRILQGRGQATD